MELAIIKYINPPFLLNTLLVSSLISEKIKPVNCV